MNEQPYVEGAPETDQAMRVWKSMELKYQLLRMTELAAIFERRVSELDPRYQSKNLGARKADPAAIAEKLG